MTKEQRLNQFWSSFGLLAYEENSVPDGEDAPDFPYLTYSVTTDSLGSQVALTASLWYRSSHWTAVNAKTAEISAAIGMGGIALPIDGGVMWLMRGQPFAQNMSDPDDNMIRRKYLNLTVEYLTLN